MYMQSGNPNSIFAYADKAKYTYLCSYTNMYRYMYMDVCIHVYLIS